MKNYVIVLLSIMAMIMPFCIDAQTVKEIVNLVDKNSFAYDVVVEEDEGTAVISYKLAGTSSRVVIEAWSADGSELLKTNEGTCYPNENKVIFDFAGIDNGVEVLFKIKVYSPIVSTPTRIVDENTNNGTWSFYAPFGVTANNYPYSSTFGRLIVAESATGTVSDANYQLSHSSNGGIGMGLYMFDPRMQPFAYNDWSEGAAHTRYGAVGGQGMHIDEATGQEYKRVKFSDDGRLFVARQTTERASIWEFNPENLDNYPLDIFGRGHMCTSNGCVYAQADGNDQEGYTYSNYVSSPASGFDVYGTGENLRIAVAGVKYETTCVSDGGAEAGYGKGEWHEGCRDQLDHYYCKTALPLLDEYWELPGKESEGGRKWALILNVYDLGDAQKSVPYQHISDETYWANGYNQWRAGRNEFVAPDLHLPMGIEFSDVRDFNVTFGADGADLLVSNTSYVPDVDICNNTTYLRMNIAENVDKKDTNFDYEVRRGHYENNPYGAAIAWNKDRTLVAKAIGNGTVAVYRAADVDKYRAEDALYVIFPDEGISINAIAFDYANNIYMVTSDNFENPDNDYPVNQYTTPGKLVSYALPRETEEVTTPTLYTFTVKAAPAEDVTATLGKDVVGDSEIEVSWQEPAEGVVDHYDVYVKESYYDENGNLVEGDWTLVEGGEGITTSSIIDSDVTMKEGDNGDKYTTIYEYKVETEFTNGLVDDGENSISNPVVLHENLYITGAATEYGADGYCLMDKNESAEGVVTYTALTHFVSADRGFMFPFQKSNAPAYVAQEDRTLAAAYDSTPLSVNIKGDKDYQFVSESAGVYQVEVNENESSVVLRPYESSFPYDGQFIACADLPTFTQIMSVTFFEDIVSFDATKIHISPENWIIIGSKYEVLNLGYEDATVMFCANSWNHALYYNTEYTVTFDEGAVVFVSEDGEERFSPAFTYTFVTAEMDTSVDKVTASNNISFAGNVVSAEGQIVVYNIMGAVVAQGIDNVDMNHKDGGVYIVRCGNEVKKIMVK